MNKSDLDEINTHLLEPLKDTKIKEVMIDKDVSTFNDLKFKLYRKIIKLAKTKNISFQTKQ